MSYEPSYPNRKDVEVPLLRVLVRLGGSIRFSIRGHQIEDILAEQFKLTKEQREFASPTYHAEGHRKWRNEIQFVRNQLADKGEVDPSVRDVWTVSIMGYKRLGLTPPPNTPDSRQTQQKLARPRAKSAKQLRRQALLDSL